MNDIKKFWDEYKAPMIQHFQIEVKGELPEGQEKMEAKNLIRTVEGPVGESKMLNLYLMSLDASDKLVGNKKYKTTEDTDPGLNHLNLFDGNKEKVVFNIIANEILAVDDETGKPKPRIIFSLTDPTSAILTDRLLSGAFVPVPLPVPVYQFKVDADGKIIIRTVSKNHRNANGIVEPLEGKATKTIEKFFLHASEIKSADGGYAILKGKYDAFCERMEDYQLWTQPLNKKDGVEDPENVIETKPKADKVK